MLTESLCRPVLSTTRNAAPIRESILRPLTAVMVAAPRPTAAIVAAADARKVGRHITFTTASTEVTKAHISAREDFGAWHFRRQN